MIIGLTGSTSQVGRHLASYLRSVGYEVKELGGRDSEIWSLGLRLPIHLQINFLVHLAHDRTMSLSESQNATDLIVESFSGYKVVLSSISAHSRSISTYGQSKMYDEKRFVEGGGAALKAGIIFGPNVGGVFEFLEHAVKNFPCLPLPFSGHSKMFVSHIDDVCLEIASLIKNQEQGVFLGAHPWPYSLRQVLVKLGSTVNKEVWFFRVGPTLTNLGIHFLQAFFRRNARLDSLKSLSREISNSELSFLTLPKNAFRGLG